MIIFQRPNSVSHNLQIQFNILEIPVVLSHEKLQHFCDCIFKIYFPSTYRFYDIFPREKVTVSYTLSISQVLTKSFPRRKNFFSFVNIHDTEHTAYVWRSLLWPTRLSRSRIYYQSFLNATSMPPIFA